MLPLLQHQLNFYPVDDSDQAHGPSNSAKLCFPAGITARGEYLYVAEHPLESQGAIRMTCSLQGLIRCQSTLVAWYY